MDFIKWFKHFTGHKVWPIFTKFSTDDLQTKPHKMFDFRIVCSVQPIKQEVISLQNFDVLITNLVYGLVDDFRTESAFLIFHSSITAKSNANDLNRV